MSSASPLTASSDLAETLGFAPGAILRVFGMRRSGNHAVINTILRNAPQGSVFLNNCKVGESATDSWSAVEVHAKRVPCRKGTPLRDVTGRAGSGALLVVSYEDFVPDIDDGVDHVTADVPTDSIDQDVIVFRGFLNWAASLLHKISNNDHDGLSRLRVMMGALSNYRDMLELVGDARATGFLPISYDRWVARPKFRHRMLERLNLETNDLSLGDVQPYGGGSSFQQDAKRGADLNATDRWLELINNPDFQLVMLAASQDDDLMDQLFKMMPKDAQIMNSYLDQAQFPYHVHVGDNS